MAITLKIAVVLALTAAQLIATMVEVNIEDNGANYPGCGNKTHPCSSLEFAVSMGCHNIVFVLQSSISLNTVVRFFSCHNVMLTTDTMQDKQVLCTKVCMSNSTAGCGLHFENCVNLTMDYISVKNCGIKHQLMIPTLSSAVIIEQGSGYTKLNRLTLSNNLGHGLIITNTVGDIVIKASSFLRNTPFHNHVDNMYFGRGLFILISACSPFDSSCIAKKSKTGFIPTNYEIINSNFSLNGIEDTYPKVLLTKNSSGMYGGGLSIFMSWRAQGYSVNLTENVFIRNAARGGGALFIGCTNDCSNNRFHINKNHFIRNSASKDGFGGGGIKVGITSTSQRFPNFDTPQNNSIVFQNCHLIGNTAPLGAGFLVFSATGNSRTINFITFNNSTWENNNGYTSPAVDITPDNLHEVNSNDNIKIKFHNCKFIMNYINTQMCPNHAHESDAKSGVILITKGSATFTGNTTFYSNIGSALVLLSSKVLFCTGSVTHFTNNSGYNGGAISMQGFSQIQYEDEANFYFVNNTAAFLGGAIYVENWEQQIFLSTTCFLEFYSNSRNNYTTINSEFHFDGNKGDHSNSLFISSAYPCYRMCHVQNASIEIEDVFSNSNCIGQFYFHDNTSYHVVTEPHTIKVYSHLLEIIPGELFEIPIEAFDDFNNTAIIVYKSNIYPKQSHSGLFANGAVCIDPAFNFINNKAIIINGEPNTTTIFQLQLSSLTTRGLSVLVNFTLKACPPGFVTYKPHNLNVASCWCSASLESKYWYKGITNCLYKTYDTLIDPGFWVGYAPGEEENEDNLYVGDCPPTYCNYTLSDSGKYRDHKISYNKEKKIDICSENRTGFFCATCKNGTSVYFHSQNDYTCRSNNLCYLGPLFYLLSELLPCVILFVSVVVMKVNFTSGKAYSIIFYIQMLKLIPRPFTEYGLYTNDAIVVMPQVIRVIYETLNLNFFASRSLSFCLWAGASTLDILVVKYVTIVFALFLVISTVVIVNRFNCGRLTKCIRRNDRQYSFVQPISAFLVICYFQCLRTALLPLNWQVPTGIGGKEYNHTVVFYDSKLHIFKGEHLYYAIPALIALVVIIIPPPLLLLADPLLLYIEGHLEQKNIIQGCSSWTKLRLKLKPILDNFQGCFKDKFRFFAGMYFLYRIFLYMIFTMSSTNAFQYAFSISLIIMLCVQIVCNPFESHSDNILASIVFIFFLVINTNTVFIVSSINMYGISKVAILLQCFQILLFCFPLVYGFLLCLWKVKRKFFQYNAIQNVGHARCDSLFCDEPKRLYGAFENDNW